MKNFKENAMMQEMSLQETQDVNGGSMNAPSLVLIIYNSLKGIFTPMA